MQHKALFICENNEELSDLSKIAERLEYETSILDVRSFYNVNMTTVCRGFDKVYVVKNPFNGVYGAWGLGKKFLSIFLIYIVSIWIVTRKKYSLLISGVPIVSARLIKLTFPKLFYYSYIRSVFQARPWQTSFIWRLVDLIGLKSIKPYMANHYFVTGIASEKMLLELGVNQKQITICGSITLSQLTTACVEKRYGISGILYLSGAHAWHGDNDLDVFQRKLVLDIKRISDEYDLRFVIRPHPRDLDIKYYDNVSTLDLRSSNDSLKYFSVNGSWLVVSNFSMMGFEFYYMGLKSIFLTSDRSAEKFHEWFKSTNSKPYTDVKVIRDILDGCDVPSFGVDSVYSRIKNPLDIIMGIIK